MNASAQALSVGLVSKIANIPTLVHAEFPSAVVDFSPWLTDQQTQQQADPNSIDFGFSFPRGQSNLSCGCMLLQLYFSNKLSDASCRLESIAASGHDYRGQHWQFSSLADWQFEGACQPSATSQQQLKHVFRQIYTLFGYPAPLPR